MTTLPTQLIIQEAIDMVEALATGKKTKAMNLANEIRAQAWQHTASTLAEAAAAFEQAIKSGASSNDAIETALRRFALEIQPGLQHALDRK